MPEEKDLKNDDHPVLEYAPPPPRSAIAYTARAIGVRVLIAILLVLGASLIPHPEGIWYVGRRPQWLVAIDHAGLALGTSSSTMYLGWTPVIAAKLFIVWLPYRLIWKLATYRRPRT